MDKRYQVFVSSTYQDLQEERREVMQALLELDCIPAGMELFPASSEDQWSLIKRVIDDCDYYLLIVGGRYGSTNDAGVSYTEMEYDYAASTSKPMICFLPKYPERIESGKTEQTEAGKKALAAFKEKVQHKMVKFYENPADLGSVVSRSVVKLIKNFPAEGWVKASNAINESDLRELANLRKKNEELRKQIQSLIKEAPKGAALLQQGNDEISVSLEELFNNRRLVTEDISIKVTWNELFYTIAPYMMDECSESVCRSLIRDYLVQKHNNSASKTTYKSTISTKISNSSFGIILLQFRALGLIELSSRKHTGTKNESKTFWKLTPYGEHVLISQFALKKEPAPS